MPETASTISRAPVPAPISRHRMATANSVWLGPRIRLAATESLGESSSEHCPSFEIVLVVWPALRGAAPFL